MQTLPARLAAALALVAALALAGPAAAQSSYTLFESGPVHPVALTPDQSKLLVANIPDDRLEIFTSGADGGLRPLGSVPVGMEPVAVAARSDTEAWVVNHLSDSVSIVDLAASPPRVVRTLLVGDEPRDVVFANGLAFVTTAHRGQQRTDASIDSARNAGSDDGDPQLLTPGVGRADVWVFDTSDLDRGAPTPVFGGVPVEIVTLFGDTPRALAVLGNTVYAAIFHSGNRTTTVSEGIVCNGFDPNTPCNGDGITSPGGLPGGQLPGGNAGPVDNAAGVAAPEVGVVVQYNPSAGEWQDEFGRNFSNGVRFHLPDLDVFAIDATTCGDADGCDVTQTWSGVGTILFNMIANPLTGRVYVSNVDSQNLTRFEGPGNHGGSTVQGNLAHSDITVLEAGGVVKPRHLNRHIDYSVRPAPAGVKDSSLATPLDMALSADGSTLYVAAFGSSRIGVIPTATLEADSAWDGIGGDDFDPTAASASYIPVSGGGPAGLALKGNRLYVLTRFDNKVVIVDTGTGSELGSLPLYDAEPPSVTAGRFMLYDADRTSSNGEASCSSCHVFGDLDSLAWDLGDPDAQVSSNPLLINLGVAAGDQNGGAANDEFHPMKGPMTTQTLRGLVTSGHMHWRGDRSNGFFGIDDPNTNDSELSFKNFIVAFPGLVGLDSSPAADPQLQSDMQLFANFALQIRLPPNPIRALDDSLTADEAAGRSFYLGNGPGNPCADGICFGGDPNTGLGFTCNGCHVLDPALGHFGTDGDASFENEEQIFKIPHLRNAYQKIGMFGMPNVPFNNSIDNSFQGDQVRGFGFLHDGSTDTLFRFLQATVFNDNPSFNAGFASDAQRRQVEQFVLAFDSDLAPAVGQQVTYRSSSGADTLARIQLLVDRAEAPFTSAVLGGTVRECELVVKGVVGGASRGWLYDDATNLFEPDSTSEASITGVALRALVSSAGDELTYTCAPPGSGVRMALDRDEDGYLDFDEVASLTDPANPGSAPGACNDGVDNDGDGLTDLADPGCGGNALSNIENPQCSNGVDDDGDGLVDVGADPQCGSAAADRERKAGCGLGFELAFLLPLAAGLRRRSRRGGPGRR